MSLTESPPTDAAVDAELGGRQSERRAWQWSAVAKVAGAWLVVLAIWEFLARVVLADRYLLASPSGMVLDAIDKADIYGRALVYTGREALYGYLWGNLAAIALALLVALLPWTERVVLRLALVIYCLPLVALGPLLRWSSVSTTVADLAVGNRVYYLGDPAVGRTAGGAVGVDRPHGLVRPCRPRRCSWCGCAPACRTSLWGCRFGAGAFSARSSASSPARARARVLSILLCAARSNGLWPFGHQVRCLRWRRKCWSAGSLGAVAVTRRRC